jgi:hypothetical protein
MTKPEPGCVNCGHSHTYDGPFRPYKATDTPCWKCRCEDYKPNPIIDSASFNVEFNDPNDATRVHQLIKDGLFFQEAVDQLELRPNEHFAVVRTDKGPDGRS